MAHPYHLLVVTEGKPELHEAAEALLTLPEEWDVLMMEGGDADIGRFWREVMRISPRCPFHIVLLPDSERIEASDGWLILEMLFRVYRVEVVSVVLTTAPNVDRAIAALRAGAWEYLSLPFFNLRTFNDLLRVMAREVEWIWSCNDSQYWQIQVQKGYPGRLTQILKKRFDREIPEISQEVGVPVRKLYRGLRAEVAMSVGELLRNFRIHAARVLLRETEERVTCIARRLGFTSASSFTKVFTRYVGYAPTVFRSIMQRRESYFVPLPSRQMMRKLSGEHEELRV